MVKDFILSFLIISSITTCYSFKAVPGLDQDENKTDQQGRKQGKWVYRGKDRPNEGYPANGKVEEGTYVDDRKEGFWIKYYNDGITPKLKGEYHNHRPQGEFIKYHANGVPKEIGVFEKNAYHDSLKRFDENGQLIYAGFYDLNGKEKGKIVHYYSNGQKQFEYTAVDGKPVGKAYRYYENGDIKEEIDYDSNGKVVKSVQRDMVNPPVRINTATPKEAAPKVTQPETLGVKFQPNGYNKVYNSNKEIWQDGQFKNGQLWDGKVYEYDKDGILLKVKVYKNGTYHSDGQL